MPALLPGTILLAGPTATGKSEIAVRLAARLGGEIVGADARQIYKALPTLTAVPDRTLLAAVPHHLVAALPPENEITAYDYAAMAAVIIARISAGGARPIIVGGTGLYFQALAAGLAPAPPPDPGMRAGFAQKSLDDLVSELRDLAPAWAAAIDLRNRRRVERALERVRLGQISPPPPSWEKPSLEGVQAFLLCRGRAALHCRIKQRSAAMLRDGAIAEVADWGERPLPRPPIGFDLIRDHLLGKITFNECLHRLEAATRQYAKRQMTWFNARPWFERIDLDTLENSGLDPAEAIAEKILRQPPRGD